VGPIEDSVKPPYLKEQPFLYSTYVTFITFSTTSSQLKNIFIYLFIIAINY